MKMTNYIYQSLFEAMLDRSAPSNVNKIISGILNKICNLIANISDPLVKFTIGDQELLLPLSHKLPIHLKEHPYYCSNLGRIAKDVKDKYGNLKVIDIGANVGDSVAFLRQKTSFPILCVEGDDYFFEILEKNTTFFTEVEIEKAYIGMKNETIDIEIERNNGTAQINTRFETDQKTEIASLASIINKQSFFSDAKMIKIDTDGYDGFIIKGATNFLKSTKPILFFEYDPFHLENHGDDGISIFDTLNNIGYRTAMIYDNFGKYMLSSNLNNRDIFEELHTYFSGHEGKYYCDICAFADEDRNLYEKIRKSELEFFQST